MEELRRKEDERLRAAGVKDIALEGKAAKERLDAAYDVVEPESAPSTLANFAPRRAFRASQTVRPRSRPARNSADGGRPERGGRFPPSAVV